MTYLNQLMPSAIVLDLSTLMRIELGRVGAVREDPGLVLHSHDQWDQGLSGVDAVSASVAPAWVDTQEELTTDMAIIKQKMGELSRCVGSHSRPPGPAYPLPPFLPPLALTPPGVRLDALPSFAGSTRRLSSRPLTTAATRTSR